MHESPVIDTLVGRLKLDVRAGFLEKIAFDNHASLCPAYTRPGQLICQQVEAYFCSAGNAFDLPLKPQGTSFQKRVWEQIKKIPPGEVCTYGKIAKKLNTCARAVGNACRHNPVPIVVPCHRVVSAKGLGGFVGQNNGHLTDIKRALLQHEGVSVD